MARTLTGQLTLTDHVCRACFGRILRGERPVDSEDDHAYRWLCSNCGAETVHREVVSLCSCGTREKPVALRGPWRDAGIRCVPNDAPGPEFPSVIVARHVEPERPIPGTEGETVKRREPDRRPADTRTLSLLTSC